MGKPWVRLYLGTRKHRKIELLKDMCPNTWWSWYTLLELAGECDAGGEVCVAPGVPFTDKALARELGLPSVRLLNSTLTAMKQVQLIDFDGSFVKVLSYSDRQYESDNSAERVRKYRERQKKASSGVTDVTVTPAVTVTDQSRAEQNRTDNNPPTPLDEGGASSPQKVKKKTRRQEAIATPYSPEFLQFYTAYPNKKGGKDEAWRLWRERVEVRKMPPVAYLLEAIEKLGPVWAKDGNKFIPWVTTFISQGRWSDADGLEKPKQERVRGKKGCPRCDGTGVWFDPERNAGVACACRKEGA